jgi:hypothetical protein
MRYIKLSEPGALFCELIETGCLRNFVSITGEIAVTKVICVDKDDVRSRRTGFRIPRETGEGNQNEYEASDRHC